MQIEIVKQMMRDGDFAKAAESLRDVMCSDCPESVDAKLLYGVCCHLLGNKEEFIRIDDEGLQTPRMRKSPIWAKYHAMRIAACGVMLLSVGTVGAEVKTVYGGPTDSPLVIEDGGIKSLYAGPPSTCVTKVGSIAFGANGGEGTMSTLSVSVSSCGTSATVTLPSCQYTRSGYRFVGWKLSGCCFSDDNVHAANSRIRVADYMDVSDSSTLTMQATAVWIPESAARSSMNGYTGYVRLTWSTVDGVKDYVIYRGTSSNRQEASRVVTTGNAFYYDNSAAPGVRYWYWIVPRNQLGDCLDGTFAAVQGMRAMETPNATASVNAYTGYVKVSWPQVSGARNYAVFRSTLPTFSWSQTQRIAITSNCFYYDQPQNSNPIPGVKYYYWIGPRNSEYVYVNANNYATGMRALDAPVPVVAHACASYVKLTWPSVTGCTSGYVVYRSTSPEFSWTSRIALMRGTTYYDSTAQAGVTYYYWIGPKTEDNIYVNSKRSCSAIRQ